MEGIAGIQWLLDHGQGADGTPTAFLWDLLLLLRTEADGIMAGADYAWQSYFAQAVDPFKPDAGRSVSHDDNATTHLLRHGVDIGEALKLGALWWRVSGAQSDWDNPAAALQWADSYLHMADGMYMADEEIGGHHTASRGTETCSVVETMFSMRIVYEITGNITYMDRLEKLAFNALPAALWPDVTANVYHHGSNQLQAAAGQYAYDLYFCCTANVHQGWPKFVLAAVHTAAEPGVLVVSGYSPSTTTLQDGAIVAIADGYPFSDNVTFTYTPTSTSTTTVLRLRIPCWTTNATVTMGEQGIQGVAFLAPACRFFDVALPAAGTRPVSVKIAFAYPVRIYKWQPSTLDGQSLIQGGGVEVHRGPLLYALRPPCDVEEQPAPDARFPRIKGRKVRVAENASWAYALQLSSLEVVPPRSPSAAEDIPPVPFDADAQPPVSLKVRGRLVPSWSSGASGGGTGAPLLPKSPINSSAPLEDLRLVPYGATNVRISVFPQLCEQASDCPAPLPPPNALENTNMPNYDIVHGGQPAGGSNATACWRLCQAHNSAGNEPFCNSWTFAATHEEKGPWCWIKSKPNIPQVRSPPSSLVSSRGLTSTGAHLCGQASGRSQGCCLLMQVPRPGYISASCAFGTAFPCHSSRS